jgi:hypothetical protein
MRFLRYRAGEEPSVVSRGAWLAHFGREPLYPIDERDDSGVGVIRVTTYNPNEPKPRTYREAEFQVPGDAGVLSVIYDVGKRGGPAPIRVAARVGRVRAWILPPLRRSTRPRPITGFARTWPRRTRQP